MANNTKEEQVLTPKPQSKQSKLSWILYICVWSIFYPALTIAAEFQLGGFSTFEYELVKNNNEPVNHIMEINQLRLDFLLELSEARKNHFGFLAEYNPVPEEAEDQISSWHVVDEMGEETNDTLVLPDQSSNHLIPFERVEFRISQLKGLPINLSFGAIRLPFGIWSEFTTHRNFSSTKNNSLVLGIALRKLDLGFQFDGTLPFQLNYKLAVINGNTRDTRGIEREDNNRKKDLAGTLYFIHKGFKFGINTYFLDFTNEQYALGADCQFSMPLLTLSGEIVYQENNQPNVIYPHSNLKQLTSLAGYLQINVSLFRLLEGLRIYGLADLWKLEADGMQQGKWVKKIYAGFRYNIVPSSITWLFEVGLSGDNTKSSQTTHLSTQIELGF